MNVHNDKDHCLGCIYTYMKKRVSINITQLPSEYKIEWLTFRDMPGYKTIGNWVDLND